MLFVRRIKDEQISTDDLCRAALGLLGCAFCPRPRRRGAGVLTGSRCPASDLADSCGRSLSPVFSANFAWIQRFAEECNAGKNPQTKQTATWALQHVRACVM